jgi:hypothetical protein
MLSTSLRYINELMPRVMGLLNLGKYESFANVRDLMTWYPFQVCSESPEIRVRRIQDRFTHSDLRLFNRLIVKGATVGRC